MDRPRSVVSYPPQLVPPPPELAEIELQEIGRVWHMLGDFFVRHADFGVLHAAAQASSAGRRGEGGCNRGPTAASLSCGARGVDAGRGSLADLDNRPAGPAGWEIGAMVIHFGDLADGTVERALLDATQEGGVAPGETRVEQAVMREPTPNRGLGRCSAPLARAVAGLGRRAIDGALSSLAVSRATEAWRVFASCLTV